MKRLLAVFLILVLLGSIADAASRVWKSSNGRFSVEADLLDFKDGKAQLRKSNGTVIEVPLVSLCEEDRRYVKSQFPGVEEEKLAPGTEYRDWKTKNGKFGTVAVFLGCEESKVQLRKPDGSEISVDKKLLSVDDQRWIADELQPLGRGGEGGQIDREDRRGGSRREDRRNRDSDEAGAARSAQGKGTRPDARPCFLFSQPDYPAAVHREPRQGRQTHATPRSIVSSSTSRRTLLPPRSAASRGSDRTSTASPSIRSAARCRPTIGSTSI